MNIQLQQTLFIMTLTMAVGVFASIVRKYTVRSLARVSSGLARYVDTKLTFIGVIHHEASHALLAFISGAKLINVRLFNISVYNGNLGGVTYSPRGPWVIKRLQDSLSGMAPIICGSITLAVIYNYLIVGNTFKDANFWVGIIVIMQISYHMTLSKADINTSINGIPVLFMVMYIVAYIKKINIEILFDFYKIVFGAMSINLVLASIVRILSVVSNRHKFNRIRR